MDRSYSEGDIQELYTLIGGCVWQLQHLENTVTTYTALKIMQRKREKGTKITKEVGETILSKQRKLNLGPLISSARCESTIPEKLLNRFKNFLDERNWLIHKCVVDDYLSLRNEIKKQMLFNRLVTFVEEARGLNNEIHALMESWYIETGYDLDYAHNLAEHTINESTTR